MRSPVAKRLAVVAGLLGVMACTASVVRAFNAETPGEVETRWTLRLELDMPGLVPPAVQWAVFDGDPQPGFAERLENAEPRWRPLVEEARRNGKETESRAASVQVAWNRAFGSIAGDEVHLLTSGPEAQHSLTSNGPGGAKWVVSKTVVIDGEPVCWRFPVHVVPGETARVVFSRATAFDPRDAYGEVFGQQ